VKSVSDTGGEPLAAKTTELSEALENVVWDTGSERWIGFKQALDVEQVFLALGGATFRAGGRPNLPLQHIFRRRNRKLQPEHFADRGSFHKLAVTRISSELDPEVRAGGS
jgi:hypothetical protein